MKARAIRVPQSLFEQPQRLARAVENAMQAAAEGVRADFSATTNTWNHGVAFTITRPGVLRRVIGTDDNVWAMLDEGTKAHVIRPTRAKRLRFATGGSPKTTPRVLGSSGGSPGSGVVFARGVNHPGTKAREWTDVAQQKWQERLVEVVQRAIDSEL